MRGRCCASTREPPSFKKWFDTVGSMRTPKLMLIMLEQLLHKITANGGRKMGVAHACAACPFCSKCTCRRCVQLLLLVPDMFVCVQSPIGQPSATSTPCITCALSGVANKFCACACANSVPVVTSPRDRCLTSLFQNKMDPCRSIFASTTQQSVTSSVFSNLFPLCILSRSRH
jgi:hypothetical protein